ncbi:HAD-like domain-containing protein [Achaetomium macrosporum]|uniref:Mitochondrial import inner membrane translocase subunit TIM50 n=1 Tax=Achaetomium macrosporum TaxID=79813 RepID=A0AAN7HGJ4_9PEZI|nr:HAD-like domain-containing protein [Achaetomium macrosporum]
MAETDPKDSSVTRHLDALRHPPASKPSTTTAGPVAKSGTRRPAKGADSRDRDDGPANPSNHGDRDPITPPSAASGGIPEPTAAYLVRASFAPMLRATPQPLLVVIDLNGTLLHRPQKRAATKFVERPLARAFLQRCIDKHRVVIWSSARPENVRHMCERLLTPEYASRVVAVWGRDRFGLSPSDYNRRTQCYKRLTRLWEDPVVRASHPLAEQGGGWNQGNTVLIDDSAEKARSEPHNAVTLPEFVGDMNEKPQVLTLVEEYLDTLAWQTDISTYIRSRPFTVGRSEAAVPAQEQG